MRQLDGVTASAVSQFITFLDEARFLSHRRVPCMWTGEMTPEAVVRKSSKPRRDAGFPRASRRYAELLSLYTMVFLAKRKSTEHHIELAGEIETETIIIPGDALRTDCHAKHGKNKNR